MDHNNKSNNRKSTLNITRQLAVPTPCSEKFEMPKEKPWIHTLKRLHEQLAVAIKLELSTIPPYLCALYSIKEGTNQVSAGIIRSVVVEEMLHMVLAANVLNAVKDGAKWVKINSKANVPVYPGRLPIGDIEASLLKFSKPAIDAFMRIELPAPVTASDNTKEPKTIGQFYEAICLGLRYLESEARKNGGTIFTGDPGLQVTANEYYGSGGKLVAVHDLHTALLALDEIVGQGEGVDRTIIDSDSFLFGEGIEYAHYYRYKEIHCGQFYCAEDHARDHPSGEKFPVDWNAVYNMTPNPKLADYKKGSELYNATLDFNKTYMALLDNIQKACTGTPQIIREGLGIMYDLKYKAIALMAVPTGIDNLTAGPTFEYVAP